MMNETDELSNMKAPLKTVLKNFLDHVTDLEKRRNFSDDQYEYEFQELKNLTDKLKEDPAYPCSFGWKDVNRPKNRYKDIVPYDFSRVILPKHEGIPGSDYINASYIKGASGAFAYIAAQGPLPNTVIDFWRMIWICDVQVLVMACNEREAGKFKCEAYWPVPGEKRQYGNISIELVNTSQICPDFLVRTFLVECGSEVRDVYQFHYTSWPDHGVPDAVQPILDLVRMMRDCQASETVPIVVHCSAGCGRTGTICAVDYVWACLRHGKLDEDFSLFQIALELRKQRIAMIQTKEQYILAHRAVAAMFEQQLKVIDCHIYENLDEDGEPLVWKEVQKHKDPTVADFTKKCDTNEKSELTSTNVNKPIIESKRNLKISPTFNSNEKNQESITDAVCHNSSVDNNLNKISELHSINSSSKNSESSYSRNSILSQQSNEDSIPFIDDDDVCFRPNCGRAYLNIPSCNTISKLVNTFDPFVDKVSADDSSPDSDTVEIKNKMKDFQVLSTRTLDKNTKISSFIDKSGTKENPEQTNRKSDIFDSTKALSPLSCRESYPSCSKNENLEKKLSEVTDIRVNESSDDLKSAKKVGKATVVRRPSISKLKALFEKSGGTSQKCSNDGSKRLLFRNNSHHVSRAGSAPPSLDCMDRNSAVEKESILKMVTRKFRSSSVRTEREIQTQQQEKSLKRRSATDTVKEGLNVLSRTVSFNINKTFKSYSPVKINPENLSRTTSNDVSDGIAGIYKPKSPDQPKGNSMWYDKSSLPRAVAVVKPTGKCESVEDTKSALKSPQMSPNKNKSLELNFNYISAPAKIKDFFSSLNKKDSKDSTALWYSESNTDALLESEKTTSDSSSKNENTNLPVKSISKVLPFLPPITPWKKVGQKSPLSSPDSPKNLNEPITPKSSTFYTNVFENESASKLSFADQSKIDLPKCPVPEEIIPLNVDNNKENKFWPPNSISSNLQSTSSENSDCSISDSKDIVSEQPVNVKLLKNEDDTVNIANDLPPAIPKKMVIGKNRNQQNTQLDIVEPVQQSNNDNFDEISSEKNPLNNEDLMLNVLDGKNDLYMNVNIKAKKNIEQIENTLRKNPRAAIIDLTSRESYSMEEELVKAVNQLSKSPIKNNTSNASEHHEKSKTLGAKSNSKFPGYEVIWPEEPFVPIQKSKSSSKVPLTNKSKLMDQKTENILSNQIKTGLCYSPPLRRSANASLELAKSQSCTNLDWLEPEDSISNIKEQSNTPTKKLVNEAVVELNTLLNQLTTRTLSEDADLESKSKEKIRVSEKAYKETEKGKECNIEPNDTVVHSITLVTKSYNCGSSPKEEEIVFHFPPPPRVPPPKDDLPSESFNIICKNGSLLLKESNEDQNPIKHESTEKIGVAERISHKNSSGSCLGEASQQQLPQPAPRKSKQTGGIRRSSSYSNIGPAQSKDRGYENVFLEKYQTLSKLEIKPEKSKHDILEKVVPIQKSPILPKSPKAKMPVSYVNVGDVYKNEPGSLNIKPDPCCNSDDCEKNEDKVAENIRLSVNVSRNQTSHGKSMMMINEDKESHSVYGKILKVSAKTDQISEIPGDIKNVSLIQAKTDIKKKPLHSKKSERAPLPPSMKPMQISNNEASTNLSSSNSMIPKKLPSRKLEKAPAPPPLLRNSSSSAAISKRNFMGPQPYVNAPPVQSEEKPKLLTVQENVPNVIENSPVMPNNLKQSPILSSNRFVNRGLSHSQSDVSVFLKLKERKIQLANQEHKLFDMKSLINKKTKNETVSVSSSDSDSSYERIFVTKDDKSAKASPKLVSEEQTKVLPIKSYKKEIPVAPPRSKRRSTTEVQYTKVKAKDVSSNLTTSQLLKQSETKKTNINFDCEDNPPAIPLKTKDTFEIPEERS